MAAYTRAEKAEAIAACKKALLDIALGGEEVTIGTRRLRRADVPSIQAHLEWLDKQPTVEDEAAGQGSPQFHQGIMRRYS